MLVCGCGALLISDGKFFRCINHGMKVPNDPLEKHGGTKLADKRLGLFRGIPGPPPRIGAPGSPNSNKRLPRCRLVKRKYKRGDKPMSSPWPLLKLIEQVSRRKK